MPSVSISLQQRMLILSDADRHSIPSWPSLPHPETVSTWSGSGDANLAAGAGGGAGGGGGAGILHASEVQNVNAWSSYAHPVPQP